MGKNSFHQLVLTGQGNNHRSIRAVSVTIERVNISALSNNQYEWSIPPWEHLIQCFEVIILPRLQLIGAGEGVHLCSSLPVIYYHSNNHGSLWLLSLSNMIA
jgi:hypothetical protein